MEALFVPHAHAFLRYHHLPGIEPTYVYLAGLGAGATASFPVSLAARRSPHTGRLCRIGWDAGGGLVSKRVAAVSEDEFVTHGYQEMVSRFRAMSSDNLGMAILTGNWQIAAPQAIYRGAVSLVQGPQPSWRETLYKLTIPRTYIFGEQSLPDNDSDILPTYGIRVTTVRNAGHGMIFDNPEGFAAVITQ